MPPSPPASGDPALSSLSTAASRAAKRICREELLRVLVFLHLGSFAFADDTKGHLKKEQRTPSALASRARDSRSGAVTIATGEGAANRCSGLK